MGTNVFISHPSTKRDVAEHVARYLEQRTLGVWYAPRNIAPGADWPVAIKDAIAASDALVLLFCADADASDDVSRELALADAAKVPVYWLKLESIEPNRLQYFLASRQWVDWIDQRDAALDELVSAIQGHARTQPLPPAAADPGSPPSPPGRLPGWPEALVVMPDETAAAECAAHMVLMEAARSQVGTILVPTGQMSVRFFRSIVRHARSYGDTPFYDTILMNDTETFGVTTRHRTSRARHVVESLIEPLGDLVGEHNVELLTGSFGEVDPLEEATRILKRNPPIIEVCSISPTGEVYGYEVGTYTRLDEIRFDRPRINEVSATGRDYNDPNQPSRSVVTVGLGTVLSAGRLVLVVTDRAKVRILRHLLTELPTAGIPGTVFRLHDSAVILTTAPIAALAGIEDGTTFDDPKEAAAWVLAQ